MNTFPHTKLINWFNENRRNLPWRMEPTPYSVWISEIMLQQTQVSVVIPYYLKWMENFPSIEKLAKAKLEDVIKLWEGLGYYSRAKNIHSAAQSILVNHGGIFPHDPSEIQNIKGIGKYTLGAILNFAFHQKYPAVDGNVIRVLTRFFAIQDDISKSATIKYIDKLAAEILPDEQSWVFSEALIELGATVCQKKPKCKVCPLNMYCKGFANGIEIKLPVKQKKTPSEQINRVVAIMLDQDEILIKKVEPGKLMSGLYEFPYVDVLCFPEEIQLHDFFRENFGLTSLEIFNFNKVKQSFTKYRAHLSPYLLKVNRPFFWQDYEWITIGDALHLPFSSGHRRILNMVKEHHAFNFSFT